MSKQPLDGGQIDEGAYRDADAHFRLVTKLLPPDALHDLAKEVVRRLAFRMPRQLADDHLPNEAAIAELCAALLSSDEEAGDRIIFNARRDGVPPETIYLSYVAGAARQLGKMWEADEVSFLQVTLASGRLYRIILGLRYVIDGPAGQISLNRHVMFALVPGETHTLGIEIATDVFRRRGWDIEMSVNDDQDTIVERLEHDRFAAIVVIANSESKLAALISLILSLRISQPLSRIVVAGNIVNQVDNVDALVGADATLADIRSAPDALDDMIATT